MNGRSENSVPGASRGRRLAAWMVVLTAGAGQGFGQIPIKAGLNGAIRIHNTDLAVLEAGDQREDLPCIVSPDKAFLGFDLRFHAGYDVALPLRELSGNENFLTVIFRVYPATHPEEAKYFTQRIRVPSIEEDAKGDAYLQGNFNLGEGKYKVDWLMRDRAERVCSDSWEVEAELSAKDRQIALVIAPNAVEANLNGQFDEEPALSKGTEEKLSVKVLVNFDPQRQNAASLRPVDTLALVSILRTLSRDNRIEKFNLVAFSLNDQKVFFRQDNVGQIDFPALGKSLEAATPGKVDLSQLAKKNVETEFLAKLVVEECLKPDIRYDAVIFAGPKALLDANIPENELRALRETGFPFFYMNYILNPQATPWRDTIGNAVKALRGVEYTISRPRDLWFAVTEMIGKIAKLRNGKEVAHSLTQ